MELHPAPGQAYLEACRRYQVTFPGEYISDFILPEFMFTMEAIKVMNAAVERGTPVSSEEVEKKYGPLSWEW